jgi:hypothetical protein
MKRRRLVAMSVLLGTLIFSGLSASADEKLGGASTQLGNGTLSGYVDTSTTWSSQPQTSHGFKEWLQTFFHWFRFRA